MLRPTSLLAIAALAGACATPQIVETGSVVTTAPTTTTTTLAPTTTTVAPNYYVGYEANLPGDTSLVAMARGELEVYVSPDAPEPETTLPGATVLGTVTVVGVIEGPTDGWAKVMLPVRPNGSHGWVRTDDVDLFVVEGRLVVDLSEKELTYYKGGEAVLTSTVAIGTSRNPTPTGQFFVTDNVTLANPNSPWGPHALGLSGRSDTITEYNGGDGIIGIHGTNRPGSIGNAASLGCVRLPNDIITQLHEMIAIGTPVEIRT